MRREWQNLALPLTLILTAVILVGGDLAGVLSLNRIVNFWPLALITIGFGELVQNCGRG
jgi:hypothetical protein